MQYEKFLIKEYKYWKLYLHENQFYLGRVYIWAKRENALDFFDISNEEIKEYFKIGKELKKAFDKLFQPDLYNYATLGNVAHHLHTHFIPRYKTKRELFGINFKDKNFGENYAPYDKKFKVPEEFLMKLRDLLRAEL